MLKTQRRRISATIADVLGVRSFLFLWLSQIFSQIAFNMLNFVLVLRVYQLTSSNIAAAGLVLTFMVPQLILSLFAGVLVDRFEKKLAMLLTNAARALSLLPLILFGSNLFVLYTSALLVATVTQFFLPAEVPMIPRLVGRALLLPANALFTGTLYGSIIVGYIFAGLSLKFIGPTITFLIIAICFAIASFCNSLLPGDIGGAYLRSQVLRFSLIRYGRILSIVVNDIGEALFTIFRSKHLFLAIMFLTISQTVIVILGALLPGYTATILSLDVEDSSFILLTPAAFGMVVGSILVSQIGHRMRRSRLILPGILLSGVALLLLPIFSRVKNADINLLYPVALTCFFLGLFNAMVIIPSNIIVQEKTVESIRGRVYGMFNALSALFSLFPVAIAGYFSDVFGVGRVMTAIGITIIVFGFTRLIRGKEDI